LKFEELEANLFINKQRPAERLAGRFFQSLSLIEFLCVLCASAAVLEIVASGNCRSYNQFMLDWTKCSVVERSPEKVSGAWLFKGTRVPVKALFENLEDGARIDDFLEWFPGVTREQVEAVLEHAERSLIDA
jgi:uncharacterized protein (DUF433 family)